MPGSNSRPNVSEGYEVPTELPGSLRYVFYERETNEQANSTRIIPSMVTHSTPININTLHVWRTLSSLTQYLASLKYSFLMSKTGYGHLGFDAQESPSKECRHAYRASLRGRQTRLQQAGSSLYSGTNAFFGGYQAIIFKLGQRSHNATS